MPALPALLALALAAAPAPRPSAPPAAARPAVRDIPLPPPPVFAPRPAPAPAGAPAAAPVSAPGTLALRVAVPAVKVQGELPPRHLALLEAALAAELRKLEAVSATGAREVRELLPPAHQQKLLGCAADEACLAEIGAALGTDEVLQVSVVVADEKTVTLSAKRVGVRSGRVTGSDQRRLTRAKGAELLGAVGPVVQALFPERALRAGRTRGAEKDLALRLDPPPLPRWAFFATAGAAVAAAAGGATYGYLAHDARSDYNDVARRALIENVSAELADLDATAVARARTANLLFVTAGVLGVAAGVEAFFTDWHGYRAEVEVGPGSAAVKVGGRF